MRILSIFIKEYFRSNLFFSVIYNIDLLTRPLKRIEVNRGHQLRSYLLIKSCTIAL
jgi:hypothetical protein